MEVLRKKIAELKPRLAGAKKQMDELSSKLQTALGNPKVGDVMADVANYTNISPVMQISEVVS